MWVSVKMPVFEAGCQGESILTSLMELLGCAESAITSNAYINIYGAAGTLTPCARRWALKAA